MPNHITNRLTVNGSPKDVAAVFDYIKSDTSKENGIIDFNKIVPMPKALDIPSSSLGEDGKRWLLYNAANIIDRTFMERSHTIARMEAMRVEDPDRFQKCIQEGRKYLRNIAEYGYPTWYEWRLANWGTKWNAYDAEIVSCNEEYYDAITFRTAWNGVPDLIAKLAEKFPNVSMNYIFADENYGYNTGIYELQGSEIKGGSPDDASKEAWQIVFELGLVDPDELIEQSDGTYRWKDED